MPRLELTLCEYNLENLFLSMEYYDGHDLSQISEDDWKSLALAQLQRKQKSIIKLRGLRDTIQKINPDILMLTEVGGHDSLLNFNRHFLADAFDAYFVAGNSKRSIDLAFLVRKGIGLRAEAVSNKDTPVEVVAYQGKYEAKFSRDVAELRLYREDQLCLILLLVHLKSKISSDRDFQSNDLRAAEAKALAAFYNAHRVRNHGVPFIVGGDFNAGLDSRELQSLKQTDLEDMHAILGTDMDQQVSLVFFDFFKNAHPDVIDYLLVSPELKDRIVPDRSYTYRYRSFYDIPNELPQNKKERYLMPSDHYPLVITIELGEE